jgi:flavin reductase (DIM6/NTAB) family NADH-FMN oxidoreductase RutF
MVRSVAAMVRASHTVETPDGLTAPHVVSGTKLALRRLASAVSVVTCRSGGEPFAMTATSVTAVSMAPPSLLACVNRSARFHAAMDNAEIFAINILGRGQEAISRMCGGAASGAGRFAEGDWDLSSPAPMVIGAQAAILCLRKAELDYGSHTIFIGDVVSVTTNGHVDPLIYVDGAYVGRPLDGRDRVEPVGEWYLL